MTSKQGSANPNAKIDEEKAALIKQDIVNGYGAATICALRLVPRHTVYNIINDMAWTHVPWPTEPTEVVTRVCGAGRCEEPAVEFEHHCVAHAPENVTARNAEIREMRKQRSLFDTARHFGLSEGRVSQITNGDTPRRPNSSLHPMHRAQERARS